MSTSRDDKQTELQRYDRRAAAVLSAGRVSNLGPDGAAGIPVELRAPCAAFEAHIRSHARPGVRVLDLCCGNGQHSLTAARCGATVTVSDLAPSNVELALVRAARAGLQIEGIVADAEKLPLSAGTFDVVTCAGSLSYVDLDTFLREVCRVLRPAGAFIFVDSLNHNPVYRLNRWRNYRRGLRTRSTLERMCTMQTLGEIGGAFPDLATSYHGVFSFLAPMLKLAVRRERVARWLDAADHRLPALHRFAFKVVGVGHKST